MLFLDAATKGENAVAPRDLGEPLRVNPRSSQDEVYTDLPHKETPNGNFLRLPHSKMKQIVSTPSAGDPADESQPIASPRFFLFFYPHPALLADLSIRPSPPSGHSGPPSSTRTAHRLAGTRSRVRRLCISSLLGNTDQLVLLSSCLRPYNGIKGAKFFCAQSRDAGRGLPPPAFIGGGTQNGLSAVAASLNMGGMRI